MVEGTPLLREHAAYTRIEGSNPSVSAKKNGKALEFSRAFLRLVFVGMPESELASYTLSVLA